MPTLDELRALRDKYQGRIGGEAFADVVRQAETAKRGVEQRERGQANRQRVLDFLGDLSDPGQGRRAFERLALGATPSVDAFAQQAQMRGGSFRQAQEAQQAATSRAVREARSGFQQFQLQRTRERGQTIMGLLQADRQQRQFEQRLAERRRQFDEQNKGPGLGGVLGFLGGSIAGSFLPPLGAAAGGTLADRIFSGFDQGRSGGTSPGTITNSGPFLG